MATQNVRRLVQRIELVRETVEAAPSVRVGTKLSRPETVASLFGFLRTRDREEFHVAVLDGKHKYQATALVSVGTLNTSLVHPREVFKPAIMHNAAALIAVHNHPSGDPEPSAEDLEVTRRLLDAGKLLGIPLLDHVIIGDGDRFCSLRGRLPF